MREQEGMDRVRWVVGMGFCVQGFRCFPWLGVAFFLKDALRMDASSTQILQNSANLPMVAKPLVGILSDALPIRGQRRLPYVAIGALLQAISWLAIVLLPESSITISSLIFFLLLGNLGASIVEVANDAIVAEVAKQNKSPSASGQLQSFVCMCVASAGALGNLIGGIAIKHFSPKTIFLLFGLLLMCQFFATISVSESSLKLPQKAKHSSKPQSIHKQLSELSTALCKPEICFPIAWFAASYAMIPLLLGTMFFYQTQVLNIDPSTIGLSKVFGQASLLVCSVAYDKVFKKTPIRKLLTILQCTIALCMVSDALFVKGFYREIGIPDSLYVLIFSGLQEALFQFKGLPFSVLMARLCPPGFEGSVMAFLMSAIALSMIISGYLGVALASFVGASGSNVSQLMVAILIQAACTLLPLFWSSWIPDISRPAKKNE